MVRRSLAVVVALGVACATEPEESIEQRCERLRDHIVERELANATGVDRAKHAEAMREALGATFVARCTTELTEAQRECALGARDSFAITTCSTL